MTVAVGVAVSVGVAVGVGVGQVMLDTCQVNWGIVPVLSAPFQTMSVMPREVGGE